MSKLVGNAWHCQKQRDADTKSDSSQLIFVGESGNGAEHSDLERVRDDLKQERRGMKQLINNKFEAPFNSQSILIYRKTS